MPIKILESKMVSRIAAGEVVERPASVVKELVENSLDAGASQILVENRDGGTSLIQVTDNGSGIPAADIPFLFQRHATSKISHLEDLDSIATLGFRGEALASIAAVAEVEIVTCTAVESIGTHLSVPNGAMVKRSQQARSPGTTVTVRNLFRQVPARLKFLKSTATENSHLADVVTQYALAFPQVRFTLLVDGRTVLQTPGSGRLIDSITAVYGVAIGQDMLSIENRELVWRGGTVTPMPAVSGMVSSPRVSRSGRGHVSFFVNHRWISSRLLTKAVEEAYRGLLMEGRYPVAVINIELPPQQVDVNVHPSKIEVKFADESAVFTAVQRAVRHTLVEQTPVPKLEEVAPAYVAPPPQSTLWAPAPVTQQRVTEPAPATRNTLPILRVLGQVARCYIVAEGDDGLYLIDQHAAHERITFEKIQQQRNEQHVEIQGLLEPATLEANPQQAEALRANYQKLAEFGFSLEPFGDHTYLVRAIPASLGGKDWANVVWEWLDSLSGTTEWTESLSITIACHSAIRAGQVLSDEEMHELVRQLEQTTLPRTCPHGRPTVIHLPLQQLEREFGRS